MLSTAADVGVASKRKAGATYGRNKARSLPLGASDVAAPAARAQVALQPPESKPKAQERHAPTRAAPTAQPRAKGKEQEPAKKGNPATQGKLSSFGFVVDSEKKSEAAKPIPDARPALKRKPTQQPTTREPKKQRSSSPDIYAFPGDLDDERPFSVARSTVIRDKPPVAAPGKRPARLTPPRASTADPVAVNPVKSKTAPQSIPIRPPRKLKPQSTTLPPTTVSAKAAAEPPPTKVSASKDIFVRRSSPEKRPKPESVKDTASKDGKANARRRSPERMPKPPLANDSVAATVTATVTASVTNEAESQLSSVRRKLVSTAELTVTKASPVRKRARLIDTLTAQAEASSSSDSSSGSDDETEVKESQDTRDSQASEAYKVPAGLSPTPAPPSETPRPRTSTRPASMPRRPGLKYTYSQQRTMLADDFMSGLDSDQSEQLALSQPLLEPPSLLKKDSVFDFDDGLVEDASTSGAVRSLHELRKAGANNRTTDEMNDILDRIGAPTAKPSSGRRNALLEMAQKAQQKAFRRQFSDHHDSTPTLLKGIAHETDPIAGYLISAILVTFLGTATSSHFTRQLPLGDLASLMARLLPLDTDIGTLAKDRKSNLSKFTQSHLASLGSSLLQLDIWEPRAHSRLSPRTLALKSMHLIMQQSGGGGSLDELFSADTTENLFAILASAAADRSAQSWDFPTQSESLDLFLALHLLEGHSIDAMQSSAGTVWNSVHLPVVARILETSLTHRAEQLGELEMLVLKLTLNAANNNPEAHSLFLEKGILRYLIQAACSTFDEVLRSVAAGTFVRPVLDTLVLVLGVMINLSEHGESAGRTLSRFEALDQLIGVFLRYRSRTAEADSEEKSHINVAFGYLSVLLGYLCSYSPIRTRFEALNTGGGLDPLLDSIREFAVLHEAREAAESASGAESDHGSNSRRLRALIDRLEIARC